MAYTKTNWENAPSQTSPISADNLNNMENGIAAANTGLTELQEIITNLRQIFDYLPKYGSISINRAGETGPGTISWGGNNESSGIFSVSFGVNNTNKAMSAVVAGNGNTANPEAQFAVMFGTANEVSGGASITGGSRNKNDGQHAVIFGSDNTVTPDASFSFGSGRFLTVSSMQTVFGQGNIPDPEGEYVLIVGNGLPGSEKNIFTLSWNGDVEVGGDVVVTAAGTKISLVNEVSRYTGALNSVQSNLDNEINSRINGDIQSDEKISNEIAARNNAMTDIQSQIDAMQGQTRRFFIDFNTEFGTDTPTKDQTDTWLSARLPSLTPSVGDAFKNNNQVQSTYNHLFKYYSDPNSPDGLMLFDEGIDTVSVASATSLGVTRGAGDIYIDTSGDMWLKDDIIGLVYLGSQPDFREKRETVAAFSDNLAAGVILGDGWSLLSGNGVSGTYAVTAGATGSLSYQIPAASAGIYELIYTQTGTSANNTFIIAIDSTPDGQTSVKQGVYYDANIVFTVSAGGTIYLNIVPSSGWSGTFSLTGIKRYTSYNSETLKIKGVIQRIVGNSIHYGNGGQLSSGNTNASFGTSALQYNTSGAGNSGFGYWALLNNTSGTNNTGTGKFALYNNTSGNFNSATGYASLYINSGNENTATGSYALRNNIAGSGNTGIGYLAGDYLADGKSQAGSNNSVYIGARSRGGVSDHQTNQNVFGYGAMGNGSNTVTLGNSEITGLYCQVNAITQLSDRRIKTEIEPADLAMCKDAIMALPVTRYAYKPFSGAHADKHVTGFLAEDVEKVFPKSVNKSDRYFPVLDAAGNQKYKKVVHEDGSIENVPEMFLLKDVKDITMTEAVPTMWGALQWLVKKVEELEKKVF